MKFVDPNEARAEAVKAVTEIPPTPITPNPTDAPTTKVDEPPIAIPVDLNTLTTEQIVELVNKRGLKLAENSLTDEEKEKQASVEELEKIKFAVENQLITTEQYNHHKAVVESKDGEELTKKQFSKSFKKAYPESKPEDVETAYAEYYAINPPKPEDDEDYKSPYTERQERWGKERRQTEVERMRQESQMVLNSVDDSFKGYREYQQKGSAYVKNVDDVLNGIDFSKYPVEYQVGEKGDKKVTATIDLGKELAPQVKAYLLQTIGQSMIASGKETDKEQIKKMADGFVREVKQSTIISAIWDLAKSEGTSEAKVGSSSPITSEAITNADANPSLINIQSRIPDDFRASFDEKGQLKAPAIQPPTNTIKT